jgi:pSer/pThr/pTyr-binding forkhead associated (FHA) protein
MARLILTFNKQVIKEFPFAKDGMTVGRKPENDIQIDNLAVSSFHARIDKAGSDFILTDLQSTNGTFIKDKKIVTHKLKHGDNVVIGKHVLLFLASEKGAAEKAVESEPMDMDKTMMLDTAKQREMLAKTQATASAKPVAVEKIGVLSFLEGSMEGEIELVKKLTRVGKSENSEVRLSGLMMGATAATISKRPSGYTISFAGGMTKVRVNGQVVKESVPLKDFDTIEIGSYKCQFYMKDSK